MYLFKNSSLKKFLVRSFTDGVNKFDYLKPLGDIPEPQLIATHIRHGILTNEGPSKFAQSVEQKSAELIKNLYGVKEAPKVESSIAKAEPVVLTPEQAAISSFYESAPSSVVQESMIQSFPEQARQEANKRRQENQANIKKGFGEIVQNIKSLSGKEAQH